LVLLVVTQFPAVRVAVVALVRLVTLTGKVKAETEKIILRPLAL
jgi:hypothetical protein